MSANQLLDADSAQRRVIPFVFLTVFLDLVGFGIILPLLPLYVDKMGGSAETVGFLFMCFSLSQLAATPVLGRLSDRFGRRPVILLSLAGNALAMLAFAFATKLLLLPLLFASRIFAGATSGNLAACQAAISDVTTERERAEGMGRVGAGLNLGLIVGPLLGSVLSEFGPSVPPLAAGALAFADFFGALFLMPETRQPGGAFDRDRRTGPGSVFSSLVHRDIVAVLLLYFLSFLTITNMQVALSLLAKLRLDWGPREVGWLFAIFGALSFVVQGILIGRLARRFGEIRLVVLGSILTAVGSLLIAEGSGAAAFLWGVALFGAGVGMIFPLLSSLASQSAHSDSRGFVLGIAQAAGGLARTVGPVLGGLLFRRVAPAAPFVGGAVAALLCVLVSVTFRPGAARARR